MPAIKWKIFGADCGREKSEMRGLGSKKDGSGQVSAVVAPQHLLVWVAHMRKLLICYTVYSEQACDKTSILCTMGCF
jgi:hypothetical protein